MFVLRYVALSALAVWTGALVLGLAAGSEQADVAGALHRLAMACGTTVVVALSAIKLIGPPPAAFPVRVLVAAAMLAVSLASGFTAAGALQTALTAASTAAGLFLLTFYARE